MIDQYRARISGDVGDAVSLGQQPLAYAQLGMEQGKALSPAAMQGSQYLSGAALAAAKGMMGRYMGAGNALRGLRRYGTSVGTGYTHQPAQGRYGTRHDYGGAGTTPTALARRL
jgi:hypothetical protein